MQIKEFLSKRAVPFLLGVVVTVCVSRLTTPNYEGMLSQNHQEIVDVKNTVQGLRKLVSKRTRAINNAINELPQKIVEASKPAKPVASATKKK